MIITVIGLGEVGGYYARGLIEGGAKVRGYDICMVDPRFAERFKKYKDAGITLCETLEEAVVGADIVMVLTTSKAAISTAESVKPYLKKKQIYIEFNSAIPSVKEEVEMLLKDVVDVVDGTTMASANQLKHKTPVNFSGARAKEVSELLNRHGMNTRYIGEKVGQAAALKVIRSIFMKGFETVLVECMQASYSYEIVNEIWESILEFFDTKPMADIMTMFITTDAIHSGRRAEEMESIADLLKGRKIENTMSVAAIKKLKWVTSLEMGKEFGKEVPGEIYPVLDRLCAKQYKSK
ncbi:MAG: NAD(P)-binding domain-containing protein [Lachnospiraceae bacterium]|nr:NAD(P)-binding domain-containing protein [Lachnospiraceae bacterium]